MDICIYTHCLTFDGGVLPRALLASIVILMLGAWFTPTVLRRWRDDQLPIWGLIIYFLAIAILIIFFIHSSRKEDEKSSEPSRDTTPIVRSQDASPKLDEIIEQAKLAHKKALNRFNRGIKHLSGKGLEKNAEKAFTHFEVAAEDYGLAEAQNILGFMYEQGRGVTKDQKEAVRLYQKAAEQGYAPAQHNLGVMYEQGRGVTQNYEEAVDWYQKAAKQRYAESQNNLGWMYESGRGVTQDDEEAVRLYRKAAEQGFANAQNNLGWMYYSGNGVAQDDEEAVDWYQKAAGQELAHAQTNLGWMYATGRGVTQDDEKAVQWYQKAAEEREPYAQANLAVMYANGAGVPQDDEKAVQWYQKAVQQLSAKTKYTQEEEQKKIEEAERKGDAFPLYHLGWMYVFSEQVTRDYEKAEHWLTQASQQGYLPATRALVLLEKVK